MASKERYSGQLMLSVRRLVNCLRSSTHLPPGGDRDFFLDGRWSALPKTPHSAGLVLSDLTEALDRAEAAWSAVSEVLELYQVNRVSDDRVKVLRLRDSMESARLVLYQHFLEDKGESFLKFSFNNLMCRALRETELMEDEFPPIFTGSLWRMVKHRLLSARSGTRKDLSFFYSLLQSKRKWLKLSIAYEEKAIDKHKATVCGRIPNPLTNSQVEAVEMALDMVVPSRYERSKVLPTFSSCLESNRASGGNHGIESVGDDIVQSVHYGWKGFSAHLSNEQFRSSCSRALDDKVQHRCELQVLPEPGKFRIITKGPSSLYTAARGLQGFLLDAWKGTPFSTMTPIWEDEFSAKLPRLKTLWEGRTEGDWGYCSGDYSAATDNLNWYASKYVITRVLERFGSSMDEQEKQMIEKCWSLAEIKYAEGWLQQTTGQLMGHPLSFPVLCILNLASFILAATSADERKVYYKSRNFETLKNIKKRLVEEHGLIVNGDDIAFASTTRQYRAWGRASHGLGLEKSVGKNYWSQVGVMINSVLFDSRGRRIAYANLGLAYNHKLKSEPRMMLKSIARVDQRLRRDLPEVIANKLRSRLLRSHANLLKTPLNWFLPVGIGGLGLENLGDKKVFVSDQQRRIAWHLEKNPLERVLREKLDELPVGATKALRLVKKVLPPFERFEAQGPLRHEETAEYAEEVFSHFCGISSYLKGAPKPGDYERSIRNIRGPRMSYKRVLLWEESRIRLSLNCEMHPGSPLLNWQRLECLY